MAIFHMEEMRKANPRVPACRDMDPTFFVGPDGGEKRPERETREAQAKLVCLHCPLVESCLEWALDHGEKGVWGATNVEERRVIKRKRYRGRETGSAKLTPHQRSRIEREELAWTLHEGGHLTVPEIALRIGVSTDTAYTYIRRQKKVHLEGQADPEAEAEAGASRGWTRHEDTLRKTPAVLTTTGDLV